MTKRFQGFYFKQDAPDHSIAFIGAIAQNARDEKIASIQVALPDGAFRVSYPADGAKIDSSGPDLVIGPNRLNASGLTVDLSGGGHSVQGALSFGPLSGIGGDIMGPFRFLPGMECRHRLVSMAHEVHGQLAVDGKTQAYQGAPGYIEGDSGRSFPTRYLWTQCFRHSGEPRSLMLSVAEIPYAGMRFTGVVGVVRLEGRDIRLATYLGARVAMLGDGRVEVRQGDYALTAAFDCAGSVLLHAPVEGGMTRSIGECLAGRARYRLTRGRDVLFDFLAENASFEYEYDR